MKIIVILLLGLTAFVILSGCTSPEKKAAEYLANGEAFLVENKPQQARIEFKNALQINQNLPAAWFGLVRVHEQSREWGQAHSILVQLRSTNPMYMDGRVLLANFLLAADQIDEALEDATDIAELAPDDARTHAIMAAVQFRLNDFAAARQAVDQALQLDPQSDDAILVRAKILIAEKRHKEALALLDKVLATRPDYASYYLMKLGIYDHLDDPSAALQTYSQMVQQFPDNDVYQHALIRHHIDAGNLDQAEMLLKRRVEEDPQNVEEKLRFASFLNLNRTSDEAIDWLKIYIEQDSDAYPLQFELAEIYLRNNQTEQAIGIYEGIIREDELGPNGLQARNVLARIYLLAGMQADSRRLIDEVLTHNKNNRNALLVRASFNLADGKQDDAISNLRTVLRDYPNSVEALALLGRALAEQGASNLAIETLTRAIEIDPASVNTTSQLAKLLVQTGQLEQADKILWRSIEAGNESVEALRHLTQIKLMLGKWEQAEQLAQSLQSVEGEEARAQQALGLVYHGREQADESILAFRRAHELDPQVAEPMVALVKAYVKDGRSEKAKTFLQSVVVESPGNSTAYHLLGQLSLRDNDREAAIGYFEKAIEVTPEFEIGYLSLASIYLGENNLAKAETIYTRGVKSLPASLTLAINLALVVESQGKFDRAIELYERLLQNNPDIIVVKNNLASLLSDQRDDKASHERAQELAEDFKDSKIPLFQDTYAWASVKLNLNLEEAILILKGIIKENEDVGLYHYHLGEAYRKKGNSSDARIHLRRAIELESPESPVAVAANKSLGLDFQ